MSFVAFVITFERTEFLAFTLKAILTQTEAPSEIIIVDNSYSESVKELIDSLNLPKIIYIKTGKNLGPAGAAYIALNYFSNTKSKWIYWGDDDDPPNDPNTFKALLELAKSQSNVGVVGQIGGKFEPSKAKTRGLRNKELKKVNDVDYVTGGKQMIVSSEVVKAGILPDSKLFFGFEELEFCLRVKDAGFKILIDGEKVLKGRNNQGNISPNYTWKGKSFGDPTVVNRQYYSTRNMLYILFSRKEYIGYIYFLFKSLGKIGTSWLFGFEYSMKFSKSQLTAIYHHFKGKYGFHKNTK